MVLPSSIYVRVGRIVCVLFSLKGVYTRMPPRGYTIFPPDAAYSQFFFLKIFLFNFLFVTLHRESLKLYYYEVIRSKRQFGLYLQVDVPRW